MSIGKTFLVIGTVLAVAAAWLGFHSWFFAVEAFIKLAMAALLLAGAV